MPLVVFMRRLFASRCLHEEVVCLSWSSGGGCLSLMVFRRRLFVSHGLLEEIVSDNGPQLTTHEFNTFLEMYRIKHTRVAPYHPASSGATERCVQAMEQGLRKYSAGIHISKEHWLANFLLRYRCTPHSVTGVSLAELFLKRRLRDRFSLLKSHMAKKMEEKQQKQKWQQDHSGVKLRELVKGYFFIVSTMKLRNLSRVRTDMTAIYIYIYKTIL